MTREEMERLEAEMVTRPVRSMQYMLRRLSRRYPELPELQPDGRFGERTLEGVMRFQKRMGLPVSGSVDRDTWHVMRDEWLDVERELASPRMLRAFPEGINTREGEREEYLYVIQAMFRSLGNVLEGLEEGGVDGIHRGSSVNNVRWVQRAGQLEETGIMDRETWDALSRLYELFVVRRPGAEAKVTAAGRG